MKTSKISNAIQPSLTRKLFNMSKNYSDVIDLTLGDPDLDSPCEVKKAACSAINSNKMHYSANAGLLEARQAVSAKILRERNIFYNPTQDIILTVGGMEALYLALLSTVDPGDEVIIFSPYYVNYVQMVEMCGGKPVLVNAYGESGLHVEKDDLEAVINHHTVAVILNSPNNPTGGLFDRASIYAISKIAREHDLLVISDEVYRTLIYDGESHLSVLELEGMIERTVLIDSLSKEFSMTGWRIGYACGPQLVIGSMIKMQENIAACAPLASQYALIEAFNSNIDNSYIIDEFQKRRDYLFSALNRIPKLSCIEPKATFYMFVDVSELDITGEEFAYRLLEHEHVAVVPGVAYGVDYSNYIRIAFTKKLDLLEKAVNRIQRFIESWV